VLKQPEELTVQQAAKHFGVSDGMVYYWIEHYEVTVEMPNGRSFPLPFSM
jgi:excisionase family DNA binding protein